MNNPIQTVDESGRKTVSADSSPQPEQIGRYRVEKILGQGGFGLVFLAHDDQLQRPVAIKVPHARLISRPEDAEAYLNEARTVANLDHPNIVPVYDVGSTQHLPCYVVSKFIEGSTLAQKIKANRLSVAEAVELVATVAETLHYAHRKGLVHRDIKPGNILLDKIGKPVVADFGLALKDQDIGKGLRFAGTPAYMSPEQARGEGHRVDGRSDIFSLGVVLYELLVGRQPFRAESQAELLEQVTNHEPRPLRQYDDHIPKELDRICLKALSKRASERYSTAQDMADDLRHLLVEQTVNQQSNPDARGIGSRSATAPACATGQPPSTSMASSGSNTSSTTPTSDHLTIKIVPKGLRSFDAHDADFFLELLPGPRDREGLPDSIRFWKTRIEETDAEKTFSVGLICGPSGCGKSSLVKAGLLPRLSDVVIAVYVEATAEETEIRLLNSLRKRCPALPDDLGLKETLATLRRGQGIPADKKVVIVLDQFEQWLHAKKEDENTELVQALRQCDGGRVQCVVMVRDDFWMAVIRFMREMEIRLVDGQNSAAVDLFPIRHAAKVLAAFGRSFGALPDASTDANKDQKGFLEQAVHGLAQEGKVICVRLALFAEMMKGKVWTPASLKEVGGTEGVGVTFLEETFGAATAPPEHRYHQKAAKAVLNTLLPESGTNIKGHMRSRSELLATSGYASRPKDFDDLLRILDSEIRLITPTDPEGKEGDSACKVQSDVKFYQLTHDYLVPSLREWLTRKQKETRRGRAELLLADRATVWNARPENRQLPSLWQWLSIRCLTPKKNWTPPQRKMMRKADRYHSLRGFVVVLIMALIGWGGYEVHGTLKAHALLDSLLRAETTQVPNIVADMRPYRRWLDPLLQHASLQAIANNEPHKQLHTSLALLPMDPGQVDYLYGRLLDAAPNEVSVIRDALTSHKDTLRDKLWAVVESPEKGMASQRLRSACALASYDPDNSRWDKISGRVVEQLVVENPVHLNLWMEGFRKVRLRLLPSLVDIFKDHKEERAAERSLATNILTDYAADQPTLLADLLMDADEKQFALLYAKFQANADPGQSSLEGELSKKVATENVSILQIKEMMTQKESSVNIERVKDGVKDVSSLPAKLYPVKMKEGKGYTVTMASIEVEAVLVFQDHTGNQLAYHESGGGGKNAVLAFTVPKDGTYKVHAASSRGTGSFSLTIVESDAREQAAENLAKRQANAAVALLKMGRPEKVWPLLKQSPDPRVRSYLVHRFGPLGADASALVKRLNEEPDPTIRRALILSLGEFGENAWSGDRNVITEKLKEMYCTTADPGLHAAAEWLLRHWKQDDFLSRVNHEWTKDKKQREERLDGIRQLIREDKEKTPPQWYVNGQGQTMVVIPGPVEFLMGSPPWEKDRYADETQHKRRIGRTFAVAAKLVTLEQFRQFDKVHLLGPQHTKYTHRTDLPVVAVTWYLAAAYCIWLSKEEGIPEKQWCYEIDAKGQVTKLREKYLSLTGYRLPTEAEIEFVARAGALTSRTYGETEDLLPKYAWYQKNSNGLPWPVGSLKPNDLGLFDVQGNVFAWGQESFNKVYPTAKGDEAIDDQEDELGIVISSRRVMRCGSFFYQAPFIRFSYRNPYPPTHNDADVGFRVVRTISP